MHVMATKRPPTWTHKPKRPATQPFPHRARSTCVIVRIELDDSELELDDSELELDDSELAEELDESELAEELDEQQLEELRGTGG